MEKQREGLMETYKLYEKKSASALEKIYKKKKKRKC